MGGFRKGSEPERRVDPTDGKAYTKEEFAECYGGAKEWAAAQRVGGAAAQRGAADSKNKPGEKVDSSVSPSRAAKGSRSGDSERRVDPADGKAYLKSEFVACYGGTKEWDGARPIDRPTLQASEVHDAPESDTVEYRRDPADGRAYTKKDFVECYGGMKEWKQAERVDAREVVKDVRRIDPADGKRYTKQDFVDCYGGTNEWDRAKEAMPEVREMATKLPEQQGKGNIVNCKGSRGGKAAKSDRGAAAHSEPPSDDEISALCRQRQEARRARDFKVADAIRDKLMSLRVKINDDDRTWTAPNGHRGSWSGAGGGQKSWKKDSDKPVQSAWTAGLADGERHKAELQRKETSSRDIGWSGAEGSSVSEVFPKPSVAEKIESFLTECNTVSPLQKALVLLGLPFEIFWGVLAHSWNARHWAATEVVVLLSDASPPVQDAGVRLVARLCLHAEKVDTKFNLRSYAALFCRSDDSLFSVQTLGTLCRLGSKITLLKDAVVAVLIACHNVYYEPRSKGSGGLLNVFLEDLKAQCWDVVFSSCSDGPKSWPNDTKKIALLRDLLVNTLWPLLKTAPFLVRTLAPVLEWAKLFAVFYEVPVQVLLKKTKGNAGNDLAAAALDCMRLVLEYYPFPVIDQPDQDIGFTSVQIEAALLQGLRSFSLVSPLRMERLPPTFESLLDKTYGRDGAESFLLSEVVASLHSHTDEFRREHGNLLQAAEQGAFVEDLMCIYNLDSTILRDAAMMGKLTDDDLQTATSIAVGLLTRSPGLKPAASRPAPAAETVSPEAFVLKEIAGDAIKSLAHAQAVCYSIFAALHVR
ncbi:hypothetical protein DIPPA_14297 [Diplonema papillatum]|nr:hypothetical protein DIPPA_14297 [Diplonema papillatum]